MRDPNRRACVLRRPIQPPSLPEALREIALPRYVEPGLGGTSCKERLGLSLLQRWLNGCVELQKPPIPGFRGELTIRDLVSVKDSASYQVVLDYWARSTWAAYPSLHEMARRWIDQAIS